MSTAAAIKPQGTNGGIPGALAPSHELTDEILSDEEGKVDLTVVLPGGQQNEMTVDSHIPVMDFLVQAAKANKLSPTSHVIQIFNDDTGRPIEFKASQSIGSLGTTRIYLVSKKDLNKKKNYNFEAHRRTPGNVPMVTIRLTVNLPGKQKHVSRVNPNRTLAEIYKQVCDEKNMDATRYDFRLINEPDRQLDMSTKLSDYPKTNEINLITVKAPNFRKSTTDLIYAQKTLSAMQNPSSGTLMPDGKEKKKKGFFSFMKKDKAKFKPAEAGYSAQKTSTSSLPPSNGTHSSQQMPRQTVSTSVLSTAPQHMQPGSSTSLPRPGKPHAKKRAAPAPPPQQVAPSREIPVKTEPTEEINSLSPLPNLPVTNKLHSRNSSDSSGYHESPSSPTESPDSYRDKMKTSLDATSLESNDLGPEPSSMGSHSSPHPSVNTSTETLTNSRLSEDVPDARTPEKPSPTKGTATAKGGRRKAPAPPPPPGVKPYRPPSHKTKAAPKPGVKVKANGVVYREKPGKPPRPHTIVGGDIQEEPKSAPRRPCSFIAPPPPVSPPPGDLKTPENIEDFLPLGQGNMAVAGKGILHVNTGIGTSPVADAHSRSDSGDGSVTTLDDIGMCFEDTIAAAEEAIQREDDEGYKNEMAQFVEKMSEMTADIHDGNIPDDEPLSSPDISHPSDQSETGTFVRHGDTDSESSSIKDDVHELPETEEMKVPSQRIKVEYDAPYMAMEDTISQSEEVPEYISPELNTESNTEDDKPVEIPIQHTRNEDDEDVKPKPEIEIETSESDADSIKEVQKEVDAAYKKKNKSKALLQEISGSVGGKAKETAKEDEKLTKSKPVDYPQQGEGEADTMLEEKSISQIALPAVKTSVNKKQKEEPAKQPDVVQHSDPLKAELAQAVAKKAEPKRRANQDDFEYKNPWIGPRMGKTEFIVPKSAPRKAPASQPVVIDAPPPVVNSQPKVIQRRSLQEIYGSQVAAIPGPAPPPVEEKPEKSSEEETQSGEDQKDAASGDNTPSETPKEEFIIEKEDYYVNQMPSPGTIRAVPVKVETDSELETTDMDTPDPSPRPASPSSLGGADGLKTEKEWLQEVDKKLEEQRQLQGQYEQLQQQFGQWQTQLMQNQAILEEKKIVQAGSLQEQMQMHLQRMAMLRESMEVFSNAISESEKMAAAARAREQGQGAPVSETVAASEAKTVEAEATVTKPKLERSSSITSTIPRGYGAKLDRQSSLTQVRDIKAELGSSASYSTQKSQEDTSRSAALPKPYSSPRSSMISTVPPPVAPPAPASAPPPPPPPPPPSNQVPNGSIKSAANRPVKPTSNGQAKPPASDDTFKLPDASEMTALKVNLKPANQRPPSKRFEPQLDPHEELMIAIRNAGGRNNLRKVTVKETHWSKSTAGPS